MHSIETASARPDFAAIKSRQQAAWASGDYAAVGTTLQIVGEQLCETMDLRAGASVLDVAAGNGNATLAAARRFCAVTSTDYVTSLLSKAEARARAEGLSVSFHVADVEALPFEAGRFDYVISTFGAMFAPDHQKVANEMSRVAKPGGRIGMANWTPDSFIGALFAVLGRHVPPPAGVQSPALWGTGDHLRHLFPTATVTLHERSFVFRYRQPEHFIEVFRDFYGPVHKAFQALDPDGRQALHSDLLTLIERFNTAKEGSMRAPATYIEAVIDLP